MEEIKVSVLCLVYNHEKYLRQCLDGFVMQTCNFSYEVIIHDDASTDNSAAIIREYEEKYPKIFKPIYQTENQHSQGVKIGKTYIYPRIKGKYAAWCEGDDYWTDPLKLQKQVDFLDRNPDFAACVHCADFVDVGTGKKRVVPNISQSQEYVTGQVIRGGGSIFATNSLMMRAELLGTMPDCFKAKGFGDYQNFIYASIKGRLWCMADVMSAYNSGTSGSWTARVWRDNEKRILHHKEVIRMLHAVDEYYERRYHEAIDYKITFTEMEIHLLNKDKKALRDPKYKSVLKTYRLGKTKAFIVEKLPFTRKIKAIMLRLKRRSKANN